MKLTNTWVEKDPQKPEKRGQRKPLDNVSNEVLERYQQMLGDDACVNCVLCAEVLSPCFTYNDTYPDWMNRIQDIDDEPGYRNDNRGMAFSRVLELTDEGRIPVGLIYQGTHPALQNMLIRKTAPARALEQEHATDAKHYMDRVLSSYAV